MLYKKSAPRLKTGIIILTTQYFKRDKKKPELSNKVITISLKLFLRHHSPSNICHFHNNTWLHAYLYILQSLDI